MYWIFDIVVARKQAHKWGKGQREKLASRARQSWSEGKKEMEGASGHSFDPFVT